MLYDIGLTIAYKYSSPAAAGRHSLCLLPADLPGEQRLIAGRLNISPEPDERIEKTDFFQNTTTDVAYRAAHRTITFSIQARVERTMESPGFDISPCLDKLANELNTVRSVDPSSPVHFLGNSPRVDLLSIFSDYAQSIVTPGMTSVAATEAIGLALHRDIRFDAKATTVDTPPAEAFRRRHGVCQDFTHIMIGCLRALGIPAGYVSGFLRTIPPPGEARLEGADAMHAWVRAWCGNEIGWIEYDPTNALRAGLDHIVVARGRDYSDVAPVKGVLRTSGKQTSKQMVDVIPHAAG